MSLLLLVPPFLQSNPTFSCPHHSPTHPVLSPLSPVHAGRRSDRQPDRQTDRETGMHTGSNHFCTHTHRQADSLQGGREVLIQAAHRHTNRHADMQIHKYKDSRTSWSVCRQLERKVCWQTGRKGDTDRPEFICYSRLPALPLASPQQSLLFPPADTPTG